MEVQGSLCTGRSLPFGRDESPSSLLGFLLDHPIGGLGACHYSLAREEVWTPYFTFAHVGEWVAAVFSVAVGWSRAVTMLKFSDFRRCPFLNPLVRKSRLFLGGGMCLLAFLGCLLLQLQVCDNETKRPEDLTTLLFQQSQDPQSVCFLLSTFSLFTFVS